MNYVMYEKLEYGRKNEDGESNHVEIIPRLQKSSASNTTFTRAPVTSLMQCRTNAIKIIYLWSQK